MTYLGPLLNSLGLARQPRPCSTASALLGSLGLLLGNLGGYELLPTDMPGKSADAEACESMPRVTKRWRRAA